MTLKYFIDSLNAYANLSIEFNGENLSLSRECLNVSLTTKLKQIISSVAELGGW